MNSIHVIFCGTDTFRVEGALQGVVEKKHFAWDTSYHLSVTRTVNIDTVDKRLLSLCNVIVLGKGCRSPRSQDSYNDRPVLSLDDAPHSCVKALRDSHFYYGSTTLDRLRDELVRIALTPIHVIYDTLLQCLTPTGEAAFHRAFWIFDKHCTGVLRREELLSWLRQTKSLAFTEDDLQEFLDKELGNGVMVHNVALSLEQFKQIHTNWLAAGGAEEAWATLHVVGTYPSGLPHSWYDLHCTRIDKDTNTYLSLHGIKFFSNLYKLKHFKNTPNIWQFTPGCPWAGVGGLEKQELSFNKFIECWKYMALERRESVIQYARYWGYKGDAALLFARRNSRATREPQEALPNTIQALVVGSEGCGCRSLIFTLTAEGQEKESFRSVANRTEPSELYVRSMTFYPSKSDANPQTIIYTVVPSEKAELILTHENLSKSFDVVLLCYDGGDVIYSIPYLMRLYKRAIAAPCTANLPFIVVQTKTDRAAEHEDDTIKQSKSRLEAFCLEHRLLWPPVFTSCVQPENNDLPELNEYVYTVANDPNIAVGNAPLTWIRIFRRVNVVAIVSIATIGLLQALVMGVIRFQKNRKSSS
ncbi:unnamed protein product [Phytomonas sp. EM1]|nr:unnamed protein product [Phytomonas sp. EM1]|eukprot:CCW65368.1 unnamed protein product [Phytomonas sp. isolate EM1]